MVSATFCWNFSIKKYYSHDYWYWKIQLGYLVGNVNQFILIHFFKTTILFGMAKITHVSQVGLENCTKWQVFKIDYLKKRITGFWNWIKPLNKQIEIFWHQIELTLPVVNVFVLISHLKHLEKHPMRILICPSKSWSSLPTSDYSCMNLVPKGHWPLEVSS